MEEEGNHIPRVEVPLLESNHDQEDIDNGHSNDTIEHVRLIVVKNESYGRNKARRGVILPFGNNLGIQLSALPQNDDLPDDMNERSEEIIQSTREYNNSFQSCGNILIIGPHGRVRDRGRGRGGQDSREKDTTGMSKYLLAHTDGYKEKTKNKPF